MAVIDDYRNSNVKVVTVNLEPYLWNRLKLPKGRMMRITLECFFQGEIDSGTSTIDQGDYDTKQRLCCPISFCISQPFYNTLKACADRYGKSVSAVIRAILRELLLRKVNPYREFLMKTWDETPKLNSKT